MDHPGTMTRALWAAAALAALAGCAAQGPAQPPEGLRPVEAVPAAAGPDLRPIPPGPRADAATQAAAAAMAAPPPEARTGCADEFAARFRLPASSVLMGDQGRTAAGWFVDLGMPGSDRTWRCRTDPAGRVVTVTPL